MARERQPERLEIVWEAAPEPIVQKGGWQWEKLLDEVRAAPGCEARIKVRKTQQHARNDISRIRARLREFAPYEKWRLRPRLLRDDSGVYGIFATYQGVMTETEYQMELAAHLQRSAEATKRMRRRSVVRKLRKEELSLAEILQMRQPGQ
jgi:hypothetical protein